MVGKEIERKFLISGSIPPSVKESPIIQISQSYIVLGDNEERVRMVEPMNDSSPSFFYTIKQGNGMVRDENETEISQEEYYNYIINKIPLIKYRRQILEIKEGEAILDVYLNLGYSLTTAEVEFQSEDEAISFKPLLWFGAEITGDKRYKNSSLWLVYR